MKRRHQVVALVALLGVTLLLTLVPMFSALADFGTNWTATYYNSTDLTGNSVYTEILPNGINVNWGTGSATPPSTSTTSPPASRPCSCSTRGRMSSWRRRTTASGYSSTGCWCWTGSSGAC
ncbi:MAG: hypothetical protein U0521_00135 [Anaerolineae bacterium]